jgi:3-dehydroquinate synthase
MLYDVHVDLGERSYPIQIGSDMQSDLGSFILDAGLSGACLVIADEHTGALYGDQVVASLRAADFLPTLVMVPAGEPSKSSEQLVSLYSAALAAGLDRHGFIVALGGGVVGDLAGYAAASFLRGIPFVQVPTSLLAMVDSSVGGKTGINVVEGKNLVGAFHQPSLVWIDLATLHTLPEREFRAGMAEVVKYGIIRDRAFFERVESEVEALHPAGDRALLADVVGRCCEIKAEVVAADERESGLRAILNFGHTLGHAIENRAGYGGTYIHGEAISVGMVYAARLSVAGCGMALEEADRIEALLVKLGLPVRASELHWASLREAMGVDKKTVGGVPQFVLASAIGTVSVGHALSEEMLEATWDSLG